MSVHHVNVDAIRPGTLSLGHVIAQAGEIGARIDGASFTVSVTLRP